MKKETIPLTLAFIAACIYLGVNHVWGAFIGYGIAIVLWGAWMLIRMVLWHRQGR